MTCPSTKVYSPASKSVIKSCHANPSSTATFVLNSSYNNGAPASSPLRNKVRLVTAVPLACPWYRIQSLYIPVRSTLRGSRASGPRCPGLLVIESFVAVQPQFGTRSGSISIRLASIGAFNPFGNKLSSLMPFAFNHS